MILKRHHTGSFAVIPNITANDEQLEADALGVLVYLLSKPTDWRVNVANLRKRFGIGRDRVYNILKALEAAGYIIKSQSKRAGSNMFCEVEYTVYDTPEAGKFEKQQGPLPENPDAGKSVTYGPLPELPYPENQDAYKRQILQNLRGNENFAKASANAPSVTSIIWKEGRELLSQAASQAHPSIIGKWLKRVPSAEGKEKLRAMFRAAANAGTADPVSYVTAALGKEFPLPPDAKGFDEAKWSLNLRAAIKTRDWSSAWGPAPGKKGCLMPAHLITPELTAALSERKAA